MNNTDVWRRYELKYGELPNGEVQLSLNEKGITGRCSDDLKLLRNVINFAGKKTPATEQRQVQHKVIPPDLRSLALAEILALEAAESIHVRAFRNRFRSGGVLTKRDAEPVIDAIMEEPMAANEAELVNELRQVSMRLNDRYSFTLRSAAEFVLCETPPELPLAWITLKLSPLPGGDRIVIDTRPGLPAKELARIYTRASRDSLQRRGRQRGRTVTDPKTANLAVFAAKFNGKGNWREAMEKWNREQRGMRYGEVRLFTRDCRKAYERVAGEPLRWRGRQKEDNRSAEEIVRDVIAADESRRAEKPKEVAE